MASKTEQDALPETFAPERGELFVEEKPKPFALSLREILDEYRSDSSPARYAMAVELGEADDWELYQGPEPRTEPLYPVNGAAMQSLLHDSWSDRARARRPSAAQDWDWMEIVSEYRGESAPERAEPSAEREQPPMNTTEEQDRPRETAAEAADALPAGIYTLRERRVEPRPVSAHLSVEDILAEFRSGAAPEAAAAPEPETPRAAVEPPAAVEPREPEAPRERKGRRAGLEAEARGLFSAFRRGASPAPEEPVDEAEVTPPSPEEPPAEAETPPPIPEELPAESETPPEDAPEAADKPTPLASLRARVAALRSRRRAKAPEDGREELTGLSDEDASPAAYAEDGEYESEEPESEGFPSFGEYLLGLLSGVLVRLRGFRGPTAGRDTVDAEEEELGEELSFRAAARYYSRQTNPLRLRCRLAGVLWLVMAYLTLGIPATGMLRSISVCALMLLALQLGVMLLALDVVVGAGVNLSRRRFGADGLAVLCCLLTGIDALGVGFSFFGQPHVPLCLFSSLALIGVLYAAYLAAAGLTVSLAVPVEARRHERTVYTVTAETGLTEKSVTLLQSLRPANGFLRRSEEAPPDEAAYYRAAPVLLALAFLLSLILVIAKRGASNFLFVFTALLAPAVPVTALLSFALPFRLGAESIAQGPRTRRGDGEFQPGAEGDGAESAAQPQPGADEPPCSAAIAGWSGLEEVGGCRNLLVTDRDLFPGDAIELGDTLIFTDADDEKVISYAGTMMVASGCGLAPLFAELMERNGFRPKEPEEFSFHPGAGFTATIEGHTVYCGTGEFMELLKVSVPIDTLEKKGIRKTAVMLAIDGMIYGIFPIRYRASTRVRRALVRLMRSNRHPVFATRDFNIGSELLAEVFNLKTEGYDFPPYLERVRLSAGVPAAGRKISALVCGEGLGRLVHMADTGRRMYFVVWLNLIVSLLSSAFGLVAVFLLLFLNGSISVASLFLYAIFWLLPVALASQFVKL